jgi:hypothetical protein
MLAYSAFRSDEEGRDEWSIEIDGGAPPPASAVSSLPGHQASPGVISMIVGK